MQQAANRLFQLFIFFTMCWTVVVVCFAIYFVTQAHSLIPPGEQSEFDANATTSLSAEHSDWQNGQQLPPETVAIYFSLGWAFAQILVAFGSLVTVCVCAIGVNEQARSRIC